MGKILDFVGKRTLDIYVIHYIFISMIHLEDLGKNWEFRKIIVFPNSVI